MRHQRIEDDEFDEALTPEAHARRNIRWRRRLQNSVMGFLVIGVFLVVIWAVTGAGYFWPGWVLAAFAVVLFLRYTKYRRGPVVQGDIDREVERMSKRAH